MITALVVGTEVAVRVAHVLGASHDKRGWHTTGTCGVVGSAAACSHLMDADDDAQTAVALALAVTQAGGLKASFGTMAKPLHAGRAAADGLFAARSPLAASPGTPPTSKRPRDSDPPRSQRDGTRLAGTDPARRENG